MLAGQAERVEGGGVVDTAQPQGEVMEGSSQKKSGLGWGQDGCGRSRSSCSLRRCCCRSLTASQNDRDE